jgi:hypothetical protein
MKALALIVLVGAMILVGSLAGERANSQEASGRENPPSDRIKALESRIQELERRVEELDQRQGSIERFQPRPFPKAPNRPEPAFRFWSEQEINGTRVFVIPCRNWNDGGIR